MRMDCPALQDAMPPQPRPGFRWVRWVVVATCVLCSRTLVTQAAELTATTPTPQAVRMRDGIELSTDVYLPDASPPFPVVLLRSPYSKAMGIEIGRRGARNGYATVIQDTRGRFASKGDNLPFHADGWSDGWDGFDTIEWIARQPWCNGRIGTLGGSALGKSHLFRIGMISRLWSKAR